MQPGLNYDKHDPKFILLGKVFKFIENENLSGYNYYIEIERKNRCT